jgi:hypothetical protein
MPTPLLSLLKHHPAELSNPQLLRLGSDLGALASWVLHPEVLRRLDELFGLQAQRPHLPKVPGACALLFAQTDFPALRPAFLLPLRWQRHQEDDPHLPAAIRQLAQQVREELGATHNNPQTQHWGLVSCLPLPRKVAQELDAFLKVESGWGWLAAGLALAQADDGQIPLPDPQVWITAVWKPGAGFQPVGQLAHKVRLAQEWGARLLFVPHSQLAEAQQLNPEPALHLEGLPETERDLRRALAPCLAELEVPPPPDAEKHHLLAYYRRLHQRHPQKARCYYRQQLLPRIIEGLRQQWPAAKSVKYLVSIISNNPELVHLAIEVTRPETCLLFYTRDKLPHREELERLRQQSGSHACQLLFLEQPDTDHLLQQMKQQVPLLTRNDPPEQVVLDLTPGTKEMSLNLALETARPGNCLIYLRHQLEQTLVLPFSERLRLWSAGTHIS